MMFQRKALLRLQQWATRDGRKPLIIRGARQVGKTTLVHEFGKEFDTYLATHGIQRRLTVHDTPVHNGVAERLNRTLLEKVRAMLYAADLPGNLWGEALKHAVWLKNRTSI